MLLRTFPVKSGRDTFSLQSTENFMRNARRGSSMYMLNGVRKRNDFSGFTGLDLNETIGDEEEQSIVKTKRPLSVSVNETS